MTAFLALVAVVAFMAKAGLPWWVVATVTLLMAGFVAGMSWNPGRSGRSTSASAPPVQPVWPSADRCSTVRPASPNARVTSPDEYTHAVRGEPSPMVRNG
ncbi:hypothetical protein [Streptomyces muensis]|uniref:Uncharacterized protein n=1 Tax=Streptomyces muensis TaxID=1077944 RepID=A0A9X1PW60_STRM4|nr:hypothetical protein [Streptomyces muensis]MCF1593674.1 hypothetical protein [Streptomyces muensis]